MRKTVKKTILSAKPYVPGKPIEEVQREYKIKDIIKLASNENSYGPSKMVLDAMKKASLSVNRYPDGGCFYLRKAVAKHLKVKEDQLIFGNGSDEIIILVIRSFVNAGDEVIIADPSFLVYEIASKIEGAKVKAVKLKDFKYDVKQIKNAVTKKTKIIFLGNPDNPSGACLNKKELDFLLRSVRRDILVFLDEAYFEYVKSADYPDSIVLLKKNKNVIVTRTFSKLYGLAGLRIGYGIANSELIGLLNRIREPFNINSIAQAASIAVLKDKKYYGKILKEIECQRKFLYKNLKRLNLSFIETPTNFIPIDTKQDSSLVVEKLLKKGVIVRDMKFWKMKGFIRVSIGKEKENRRFIKSLEEIL
ncbi:MAG: histidinol-phosphate transaminase [Candidatus Zapsychrus exili]|nr:histidinol-phosphate transaminase [Candidatus Zapsychrus exili]